MEEEAELLPLLLPADVAESYGDISTRDWISKWLFLYFVVGSCDQIQGTLLWISLIIPRERERVCVLLCK